MTLILVFGLLLCLPNSALAGDIWADIFMVNSRLVNGYDFDHILQTDFSSKNDRLTGYNQLSQKCSRQDKLTPAPWKLSHLY